MGGAFGFLNCGLRPLFSGPGGTGQTLAARLLAALLGNDLYQLDLKAMGKNHISETEKNLSRLLERADDRDIPSAPRL